MTSLPPTTEAPVASQPMLPSAVPLMSDSEVTVPPTKPAAAPMQRKRRSASFRRLLAVLGGLGSVIYDGLAALVIVLLYGIPGALFGTILVGCAFMNIHGSLS